MINHVLSTLIARTFDQIEAAEQDLAQLHLLRDFLVGLRESTKTSLDTKIHAAYEAHKARMDYLVAGIERGIMTFPGETP